MRELGFSRWFAVALCVCWATLGCKFMPNRPYWIEAFGHGQANRITAWPAGAVVVGSDGHLYTYPGPWARPWVGQGGQRLKAASASQNAIYGLLEDGQVARFAHGSWTPFEGSAAWQASEVAATQADRVWVVSEGKLREVSGALKTAECAELTDAAAVAARGDEVFVIDHAGVLYRGHDAHCGPIHTPVPLRRVAATAGRLLGVGTDGTIWRRRDGESWTRLPAPMKYRPGRSPFATKARDVALSAYSTWILDEESAIFVLSDES